MAFLADLTTLLLIASLALVHDPDSLDPLAPRLPLALILLPLVLAATALTRAAVAFRAPDALVTLALYLTAAGAATSVAPWDSGPALAVAAIAAGAYLAGRRAGDRPGLLRAAAAGSLIALFAVSVTMIGTYTQPVGPALDASIPTHALIGPLANPDVLAGWLLLVIPLAAAGRGGTWLAALGVLALAWTLSRGGLLAGGAAALLFASRHHARRPLALALVGALVLTGFAAVRPSDRTKLTSASTFAKRLTIWRTAFDLYRRAPLFGHGPGRFGALYETARGTDPGGTARMAPSEFAHNVPLQIAVEYGLAGLLLFGSSVVWFARHAARLSRDATDPTARALAAGLTAFLLHNLVSHAAYILPVLALAAFLAGAAATRFTPTGSLPSPRAYPLTCVLAALVLFLLAPWALCENRAAHYAGEAQRHLARSDAKSAVQLTTAALAESPNRPRVRYLAAGALAEAHRPAAALAQYLLLEAQVPHYGHEPYDRARVLLDMNRPAPALAPLAAELRRDPDFFPAWYASAEAYYMLHEPARCRAALARARALAPTPDLARRLDLLKDTLK